VSSGICDLLGTRAGLPSIFVAAFVGASYYMVASRIEYFLYFLFLGPSLPVIRFRPYEIRFWEFFSLTLSDKTSLQQNLGRGVSATAVSD